MGFSWIGLRPDALLLSGHEGDTYHLLDVLFRMERGLEPHFDFMTPLGVLSFLPIQIFLERGYGVGISILYSQVLVAAVLFLPIFYVTYTRLTPKMGYFFAAFSIVVVLAITFGGSEPGLAISMHYNRWGWVIGFVVILVAFAPTNGLEMPKTDGVILGLGFSALALIKVTFFVALLPGIALVLVLRKKRETILISLAVGAAIVVITTATWENEILVPLSQ